MSKSKKALYAKIRNGGYGAQFDFGKIEEEYIGAHQTNGCFGCAFYLGEEKCSKRERIRKAADEDYGNCNEWIDKPTYKQSLLASSADDGSSNTSTTKKEKKEVPGGTTVKSWNLLIQEKYLEEDKDTVLPLMLNDKAAHIVVTTGT